MTKQATRLEILSVTAQAQRTVWTRIPSPKAQPANVEERFWKRK